jgi:two-component system phosphate regulon response regulator PhoB
VSDLHQRSGTSILVVDNDRALLDVVCHALEREGFEALAARDGATALALAGDAAPDLVLLDIVLDDLPGTEVCRRLKADPRTRPIPVVFVSALDTEADRIAGFELGATDYLTKPFSVRELVLRVRAILRRLEPRQERGEIDLGPIRIDIPCFGVQVAGAEVSLTRQEFRLLAVLAGGQGRVFSRGELLDAVWGESSDVLERTVDAHVKGLRGKLGEAGRLIETVHGVGYRARRPADEEAAGGMRKRR